MANSDKRQSLKSTTMKRLITATHDRQINGNCNGGEEKSKYCVKIPTLGGTGLSLASPSISETERFEIQT